MKMTTNSNASTAAGSGSSALMVVEKGDAGGATKKDQQEIYPEESEVDSNMDINTSGSQAEATESQEVIAQQEGKIVVILRMVVLLVLVSSAVAVSTGVYFYGTNQEVAKFEDRFISQANKVHEAIGVTFEETLGATDAFLLQLVAYARYSGSEWPFVTMPAFAIHASKLNKLSKAFYLTVYPFVEPNEMADWSTYTEEEHDWIYESMEVQARDPDWHGANEAVASELTFDIYSSRGLNNTPYDYMDNFLPTWQAHPMVPSAGRGGPINYDVWDVKSLAEGILHADANKAVVVSPQVNARWDDSQAAKDTAAGLADWAANYAEPGVDTTEPFSTIIFPIYDALEDVRMDTTKNNTFVGTLMLNFMWRVLIENILQENTRGIIVVFEDSCGPPFTYRLDGPHAVLIGAGDLHEMEFDNMRISASLASLIAKEDEISSYTGLPLSDSYCPRMIHIYPSQAMKDDSTTQDPVVFTIAASLIFLFTSIIFVVYDFWVNRRQRIVMQRALASGAIVSSLFPEQVRQQIYDENKVAEDNKKQAGDSPFSFQKDAIAKEKSRPNASEFQKTTILFGDLVGFTKWSSTRTPVEVFELLEAIYGRFDKVAARRKVFKVETIGDCYVAVTGLPNPQQHHASIMARFAGDCLRALDEVTHELVDSLGEDTLVLKMRIGLHSGSVTAGVLRGEKGRFQLFGDTVNTAARMETLSKPGAIHVSESCADALIASGKSKWLVPREDKVVAKGKGEMSTWWVRFPASEGSRVETSSIGAKSDSTHEAPTSDTTPSSGSTTSPVVPTIFEV